VTGTRTEFDALTRTYLPLALAVFAAVVATLAFVVVRYRRRPGRQAVSRRRSANRAEAAYAFVLAAIVAGLVTLTFRAESRVDAVAAVPALRVTVTASDWRWRFDYPQQRIRQADLYVPVGETVELDLISLDVVHAFYIPAEDFQREAFPGYVNRFDLVFPKVGARMTGSCNEFCGVGHSTMTFAVHVLGRAAFAAWVDARRNGRPQ
jgi:cytochrome c oxidase subunit 2